MGSFKFSMGGVDYKLGKFDDKVGRALVAVMGFYAPKSEAWSKQRAPWKDRTTNARNGLFSEDYNRGSRYGIIIAHSVDYGIFLELPHRTRGGGQDLSDEGIRPKMVKARPIIMPALKHWGPRVMKKMNRLIDRMGR